MNDLIWAMIIAIGLVIILVLYRKSLKKIAKYYALRLEENDNILDDLNDTIENLQNRMSKQKEKFEEQIKKPLKDFNFNENVTSLIFIIEIQKEKKIWGKCKLYYQKENDFKAVNLGNVKDEVMKILER